MERDVETYISSSLGENYGRTEDALLVLSVYLDVDVPEKCPGSPTPQVQREGEPRLEPINRCWLILKYLREAKQDGKFWERRCDSLEKVANGRTVVPSQMPRWMQPASQERVSASQEV